MTAMLRGSPIPPGVDESANVEAKGETKPLRAPWSPDSVAPNSNVIVNYLPASFTDAQLTALFSQFGPIQHYKIVRDYQTKQSLGYGFVQFTTDAHAQEAINAMNGHPVEGKRLKVSLARPSSAEIQQANVFISGLPDNWTRTDLMNLFQPYSPIIEARVLTHANGQSRNVGFCRLSLRSAAARAIEELHNTTPPNCSTKLVVKLAGNPSQLNRQRHNPQNRMSSQRGMYLSSQSAQLSPQSNMSLSGSQPQSPQQSAAQLLPGAYAPGMYKASYVDVSGYPQQSGYYTSAPTQQTIHLAPGAPYAFHPHPGHPHPHGQAMMLAQQGNGYIQSNNTNAGSPGLYVPHPHSLLAAQGGGNRGSVPRNHGSHQHQQQQQPSQHSQNGTDGNAGGNVEEAKGIVQNGHVVQTADGTVVDPSALAGTDGTTPMDYDAALQRQPQFQGVCLFVYHLPTEATEHTLFNLFSPHVTVHSTKVMKDLRTGSSRGYGFVNVATQEDAELAIQKLNGYKLANKTLRVSFKH